MHVSVHVCACVPVCACICVRTIKVIDPPAHLVVSQMMAVLSLLPVTMILNGLQAAIQVTRSSCPLRCVAVPEYSSACSIQSYNTHIIII